MKLGVDDEGLDEIGSEVEANVGLARRVFCWASHGMLGLTGYLHRRGMISMSELKPLNKHSPLTKEDSLQTIEIDRLRERKSKSGTCILFLLDGLAEGQVKSVSSEKGKVRFAIARRIAVQRRYRGFGSMCRLCPEL